MDEGLILLIVGGVLAASIVVAFGAARAGVPSLVAFLGLGMLLGSDGLGGVSSTTPSLRGRSASSRSRRSCSREVWRRRGAASARSPSRPPS